MGKIKEPRSHGTDANLWISQAQDKLPHSRLEDDCYWDDPGGGGGGQLGEGLDLVEKREGGEPKVQWKSGP
jgi:hypothetical protein